MVGLPSGVVTFLFTDVEESTRMWEDHPRAMQAALERHDEIMRNAIDARGGYVFSTAGDAFAAAFQHGAEAVGAASDVQVALAAEPWPEPLSIRVRMGIHAGETSERDGDYFGPTLNRTARMMSAAHGGQVVLSDIVRAAAAADAIDLGEHRLKDLAAPEQIWQLLGPGLGRDFPPLRSLDARRHNLPVQRTELLGRDDAIADVAALVRSNRLVTLTGFGGTGKTRLALAAAAELIDEFPLGVFLVDLIPVTDGGLVGMTAVEAAGISAEGLGGSGSPHERAASALAGKDLLLVVDNCEHLVDDVAEFVDHVLDAAATPKILATSREALEIDGEHQYRVPTFDVDELTAASPAIDLFVQRAAAVGTTVDPRDPTLAAICRRLEGVPLAIELAAARTTMLSLPELEARLGEQLDVLSGRRRQRGRHRSLEAVLDWSWNLLDEPTRELLVQLGTFRGGWTLSAAEAVCDDAPTVAERLETLVSTSLVETRPGGTGTRFRMLEPVRQFAVAKLELRADRDDLRDRHLRWLIDFTQQRPTGEQWLSMAAMHEVNEEFDNVRLAIDHARQKEAVDDLTAIVGGSMAIFVDGIRAGAVDALLVELLDDATASGRIRLAAAFNDIATGNHVRLAERLPGALRAAEAEDDEVCTIVSRVYLAYATALVDIEAASELATLAAAEAERFGDEHIIAFALAWGGAVAFIAGDHALGAEWLRRAAQMSDGAVSIAEIHSHLGLYFMTLADATDGDPRAHISAIKTISSDSIHARAGGVFEAYLHAKNEDPAGLRSTLESAMEIWHTAGSPSQVADVTVAVGEWLATQGRTQEAAGVVASLRHQALTTPTSYHRYHMLRARVPASERIDRRLSPDELYEICRGFLDL